MQILLAIALFPIRLAKSIGKGLKSIKKPLRPIGNGFEWVCIKVYRFFRYAGIGLSAPFIAVAQASSKMEEYEKQLRKQKRKEAKEKQNLKVKEREIRQLELETRQLELEEKLKVQQEELEIQNLQVAAVADNTVIGGGVAVEKLLELEKTFLSKKEALESSGFAPAELEKKVADLEENYRRQREELELQTIQMDAIADNTIVGGADVGKLLELENIFSNRKRALESEGYAPSELAEKFAELEVEFLKQKEELELQNVQMEAITDSKIVVPGFGLPRSDFNGGQSYDGLTQDIDLTMSQSPVSLSDATDDGLFAQFGDSETSMDVAGEYETVEIGIEEKPEETASEEVAQEEVVNEAELQEEKQERKNFDASLFDEEEETEKKGIGYYINAFLEKLFAVPIAYFAGIKQKKQAAQEKKLLQAGDINRQAMVLDFENAEDSAKETNKVMWEYVCKSADGKIVKGHFAAHSKLEVHSFLQTQGMTIYSIRTNKWIQTMYASVNGNGAKLKRKDLIFFLTQLSTYIKSGIPLVEAMNILIRQFTDKNYQRMFRAMMYDLTMGESFSKAMENQGNSFPPILINMVKSSELTGELPETLDDMCEYFTQVEAARKEMISALMYPSIVFIMAIGVSAFMMIGIVPQFTEMYSTMEGSEIPAYTVFIMKLSDFLQNNLIWIILWIIIIVFILIYLYRNVKVTRTGMQWFAMHIPVMGTIMIYNEVTMFSKTFSSLLSHNVFITDSMKVLKKITNNEIYKSMILETVNNLASGEKISAAFKDHWAFPIPAYEMIVTGEKTGQLAEMMAKVSSYYQDEHKNAVTRVKSLMEPIIIIFLTVVVGGIVLAIIIPMFGMYEGVQDM